MLYGAAYYPEHRPEESWAADCDLMQQAHVNALRLGEFAWSRFEPESEHYDTAWFDRFLDVAWARGIRALLAPPLRTPPQWLIAQHPAIMIERQDGTRNHFGGRYRSCINQPALRERGLTLATTLAQRYGRDERLCGWHLDNELGCDDDCHCAVCIGQFQNWCRNRYVSIIALNEAWGTAFWGLQLSDFAHVDSPREGRGGNSPGHDIAWRRFRSESTCAVSGLLATAIRAHTTLPITTNNQPLRMSRTDYFALATHLDITGTNYYPNLSGDSRNIAMGLTTTRCFKGSGRTFEVHELRNASHLIHGHDEGNRGRPGAVERIGLHAVANGADALYFFRWDACPFGQEQNHGTIQGYDGKPRRIYGEVQRLGAALRRMGPLLRDTIVPSRIALLYDFPSRWEIERTHPFHGNGQIYLNRSVLLHRVLRDQGFSIDTCGRNGDWSAYKVLVVPMLSCVDDALASKLLAFVRAGGHLVWHPLCAMKDADGRIFPDRIHPTLVDLLGCRIQESFPSAPGELRFTWNERTWSGGLFADLPEGIADNFVTGHFSSDWFAGTAAVIRRPEGQGYLHYCCCFADDAFYGNWLSGICAEAGVSRILADPPPSAIEVCERRHTDGRRLIFLINHEDSEQHIALPSCVDVYHQEDVAGETAIPARGVRVLALPAEASIM